MNARDTETCGEPVCDGDEGAALGIKSGNFATSKGQMVAREEEAVLHAGTSVFVLRPGDAPSKSMRIGAWFIENL